MPVTPAQVESELARLSSRLESKTDELAGLLQSAAEADVAFKIDYAKALLRSRAKTAGQREAEATIDCADLLLSKRTSEAVADACREAVRSLRDQLSAAMSVGANLRTEMQMAGWTPATGGRRGAA